MNINVITLDETKLNEMLRRAAQFGATIALENFKPEPFPEIMDKQAVAKYLKFSISKVNSLMKAIKCVLMFPARLNGICLATILKIKNPASSTNN